ncbi:hypothetical protein [Streptomyces litchfieldiae]|uniref:Uncharacterized protein n=1 Tax=Streptomyces litchfieldiae TaxID=3075543 RepID=A0ABU2MYS1_9ACTN|nr:hypothetical protein [Streptomyces sp. DSM 44938]MDT0346774.1 hypothetical protein [Streptomyces sp. DSM 44938]
MSDRIWSNTNSNERLFHGFSGSSEPRGMCNRRIRPVDGRRNGEPLLTAEEVRKLPQASLCERCEKLAARAESVEASDTEQTTTPADEQGPAEEQRPEWRTLKGAATPFRIHTRNGNPLGRQGTPGDETMTITHMETRAGGRYGTTTDGREVWLGGTATKVWFTPGAAPEAEPNATDAERSVVAATFEPGTHISVPLGRARVVTTREERPLFGVGSSTHIVYRLDDEPDGKERLIPADSPSLDRLCDVCDQVDDDSMPGNGITCGYCLAKQRDDEQRIVEGVIVEHAGTAEGSLPRHATHPDVVAARAALAEVKPARLTDDIDTHRSADERDIDRSVRGYMLDPRGNGRVAAYWIEGGLHTRPDSEPHTVELGFLRDRFERAGWTVEPKSLTCVFAWRPDGGDAAEQSPAPEPSTAADLTPMADRKLAENRCVHDQYARPDVSGDPVTACARKRPNQGAGVWSDEGCVYAADCAVDAANEAARLNEEEEHPADDPLYGWDLMCPDHENEEQTHDGCEECAAEDERDAAKAEHASTVEAIEDGERADGTWRGGWIAGAPEPPAAALFDVGDEDTGEQGALFA